MTKKEIAEKACEELEKIYPDVECSLVYKKPYELLIATRLAAQFIFPYIKCIFFS